MSEQLPPLPGDIEKLLAPVRGVPALPPGVDGRLWGAIAAQLSAPGAAPPPAVPHTPPSLPKPMPHLPTWLAKWPLAVAFALGGGAGAGLHARLAKPKGVEPVVAMAAPQAPTPLAPVPTPLAIEPPPPPARPVHHAAPLAPAPTPVAPAPPAPAPAPAPNDDALGAERALLEIGRTALARGQSKAAYQAMVDHERRFPEGRLSEERDAIRIQALAAMGQLDAARVLAESFHLTYPRSLLLPAVDRALSKP